MLCILFFLNSLILEISKIKSESLFFSKLYAFTFWPRRVISFEPFSTNCFASITSSLLILKILHLVYKEQRKIYKIYHILLEWLKKMKSYYLEFFKEFKLSNFSTTSNSVKLIGLIFFLI